jgi:hypothetical protein
MQRYNLRDSDERKGQGDQLSLWKIAQNVAQSIFCQN